MERNITIARLRDISVVGGDLNESAEMARELLELSTPTHRHKKRGSEYVLIGFGKMQSEDWFEATNDGPEPEIGPSVDMREVAIYRSVDDGELWVRPREEFEDGRFEALEP